MNLNETLEQIKQREKLIERLNGYACGYHKQLEKQISNQIKKLKVNYIDEHGVTILEAGKPSIVTKKERTNTWGNW